MIEQYGADATRWFILSDSPQKKMCNGLMLVFSVKILQKFGTWADFK